MKKKKVFVGLSGGVDSSVAAKRLLEEGYDVTGVFIKTWQPDFIPCSWESERRDAMRVAAHLRIPFLTCDGVAAYRDDVASYMVCEYEAGRTPNPDVMCNRYVKFGVFLTFAKEHGADFVATGHYARISTTENIPYALQRGVDITKDQSYFLWTLTQEQRAHILLPIGKSIKTDIREEARKAGLPTYAKEDSQGICFLGEINMKEFLMQSTTTTQGEVLDESGASIGTHDGALLYTIGQRHGFTVSNATTKTPHYVISKDVKENTITVSLQPKTALGATLSLIEVNWIGGPIYGKTLAQFRYRQKPFVVTIRTITDSHAECFVEEDVELPSVGQSCVFYEGDTCRGGGIINAVQ